MTLDDSSVLHRAGVQHPQIVPRNVRLGLAAPIHTVDYAPLIKSQLTRTQLTLRPYVVQIWSRNTPEYGVNETFAVLRVDRCQQPPNPGTHNPHT